MVWLGMFTWFVAVYSAGEGSRAGGVVEPVVM